MLFNLFCQVLKLEFFFFFLNDIIYQKESIKFLFTNFIYEFFSFLAFVSSWPLHEWNVTDFRPISKFLHSPINCRILIKTREEDLPFLSVFATDASGGGFRVRIGSPNIIFSPSLFPFSVNPLEMDFAFLN